MNNYVLNKIGTPAYFKTVKIIEIRENFKTEKKHILFIIL